MYKCFVYLALNVFHTKLSTPRTPPEAPRPSVDSQQYDTSLYDVPMPQTQTKMHIHATLDHQIDAARGAAGDRWPDIPALPLPPPLSPLPQPEEPSPKASSPAYSNFRKWIFAVWNWLRRVFTKDHSCEASPIRSTLHGG